MLVPRHGNRIHSGWQVHKVKRLLTGTWKRVLHYLHFILRLCFTQIKRRSRMYLNVSLSHDGLRIGVESVRLHSLTLLMGWILLFCNVSTLNQLTVQIKYLISWYICQTLGGLAHFKIMDRRKLQLLFQVLKGSHKMGRVNHLTIGDQVYQLTFLRIGFPEKNTVCFFSSRQGWTQRGWNMHKQHCH